MYDIEMSELGIVSSQKRYLCADWNECVEGAFTVCQITLLHGGTLE